MGRLDDRVAIITGGAGGIGAATGLLFCEEGARVALVDSDRDAMDAALAEIRAKVPGARVEGIIADVAREQAAAAAVGKARDALGPIDVLVNLAGIRAYEPLGESRAETWDRILDVNFLSYVWFIKAALADLRASGQGSVVNVSSTHGVNPRGGTGQYDATKAAIISMTKTLAFEEKFEKRGKKFLTWRIEWKNQDGELVKRHVRTSYWVGTPQPLIGMDRHGRQVVGS